MPAPGGRRGWGPEGLPGLAGAPGAPMRKAAWPPGGGGGAGRRGAGVLWVLGLVVVASLGINLMTMVSMQTGRGELRHLAEHYDSEALIAYIQKDTNLVEKVEEKLEQTSAELKAAVAELQELKRKQAGTAGGPAGGAAALGAADVGRGFLGPGGGGGRPGGKKYLAIGINTVPRRGDPDYLRRTVHALLDNLPEDEDDPLYGRVTIAIMNCGEPGKHKVYYEVKEELANPHGAYAGKRVYIDFLESPRKYKDPTPNAPDPDDLNNPTNRPGRHVRKQSLDVISVMDVLMGKARYYMFMEDDFVACANMFRALAYAIAKANALHADRWFGMRVSYGMNGIIIKDEHCLPLKQLLLSKVAKLPPDLNWIEFYRNQVRQGHPLVVFEQNLLEHIGGTSSFAVRPNRPNWPGCFASMHAVWSLQQDEKFQPQCKSRNDISPCQSPGAPPDWALKKAVWGQG